MRRLRLALLVLGLALAIPVMLLVARAREGERLERELRHQAVAARAFDEMERQLTAVLEREESRPFEAYRRLVAGEPTVPDLPEYVVGHFQIDPDGRLHATPGSEAGRVARESLAAGFEGSRRGAPPATTLLRSGDEAPAREPAQVASESQSDELYDVFSRLNLGQASRAERKQQVRQEPISKLYGEQAETLYEEQVEAIARKKAVAPGAKRDAAEQAAGEKRSTAGPEESGQVALRELRQRMAERKQKERVHASSFELELEEGAGKGEVAADGRIAAATPPAELPRPAREPQAATGASAGSASFSDRAEDDAAAGRPESTFPPNRVAALGDPSPPRSDAPPVARDSPEIGREAPTSARDRADTDTASAPEADSGLAAPSLGGGRLVDAEANGPALDGLIASAVAPRPADRPAGSVRVTLDPMMGRSVAGDRLLLYRTALVDELGYRQGVLIDRAALADWLERQVLARQSLGQLAQLRFDVPPEATDWAPEGHMVFGHRFAEPFDGLSAQLALAPLATRGGTSVFSIYALAALLVLVAAGGLLAVDRMVKVVVSFAERRNDFVASVSHELKTPLTAIRMYAEMLRDGLVRDEAKREEYYGTITDESERLSRLIDNVLAFSKLERGQREIELAVGGVSEVLEEAAGKLRPHAERQGFALRVESEPGLPPVRFDRDALLQVLFNLVDNAMKYARPAAPAEVVLEARSEGGQVLVGVRDFGPGVDREQLSRIFEPFYRVEAELTRSAKGTGIGLALVRELGQAMGAAVTGANAPDGGFRVMLAFDRAPE